MKKRLKKIKCDSVLPTQGAKTSPAQTFLALAAHHALDGIRHGDGGPFGAVIVKDGEVIASSHNTVLKNNDPTCHAEINAIRHASQKLKSEHLIGCEIYSTTEPCPMCFSAIHWARIGKIVYSTTINDARKLGFNELLISTQNLKKWGKTRIRMSQVRSPACSDLLKSWRKLAGTKTY